MGLCSLEFSGTASHEAAKVTISMGKQVFQGLPCAFLKINKERDVGCWSI